MRSTHFWTLVTALFVQSCEPAFAAETLAKTFNQTGDKAAPVSVFGFRGTDNKTYVLTGDPAAFTLPVSIPGGIAANTTFTRNGILASPTLDTANPANNRPFPTILLAGDSAGPISVGAGASDAGTLRTVFASGQSLGANLQIGGNPVTALNPVFVSQQGSVTASNLPGTVATNSGAADANTLRVVLSENSNAARGLTPVQLNTASSFPYVIDMASTNITNAAYVQVIASVGKQVDAIDVFSGNGQPVFIAIGGAGAEINQIAVIPGGQAGPIPIKIPIGSRISLKSAGSNLTSGIFILNAYSRD